MGRLSTIIATIIVAAVGGRALADRPMQPLEQWRGLVSDPQLRKLAPENGVITEAEQFKKLWKAWRPSEPVPEVNFNRDMVLVGTALGPNRVLLAAILESDGNIKLRPSATKIGGGGFGFALMRVLGHGVKTVNGRPLRLYEPPQVGQADESIRVQIRGRLRAGLATLGGERTGMDVTADGVTWDVSFGENEPLATQAKSLAGGPVIIDGVLERQQGVEAPVRWIIHARSVTPAR